MHQTMNEAVIVACGRTAIGKALKGTLKNTHPVDYAGELMSAVMDRIPQLARDEVEDITIGCSSPEGKMGCNMARLIGVRARMPYSVPAETINRFCSSGLQAISTEAHNIMTGCMDVAIAGGVETMTRASTTFPLEFQNKWLLEHDPTLYLLMGYTAENVARRYGISRERIDAFSAESHRRAAAARAAGKFRKEIIPVHALTDEGDWVTFDTDECIRPDTTPEVLAGLKPYFDESGCVTAGNSSQMSDGAGMVVLMNRKKAEERGIRPIARYLGFAVCGVEPAYMGIGPIMAVPKVLRKTGLTLADIDVIELNEAFGSQAIACIDELGLDPAKVNPNGGAIAMGHPLGATGAMLTCKVLSELERTGGRYGMVTMCVGGGMGAAAIFEML